MASILILIGGHLSTAPRPQKEAATLAEAGHHVMVRGFWSQPELVKRDKNLLANQNFQFKPVIDFQRNSPRGRIRNFNVRATRRVSRELYARAGIATSELLGYGTRELLRTARRTKADLTIVHAEAGLWVGAKLLNDGLKVGVDFEDWFSEDLLPEARRNRPVQQLKQLEKRLMRQCTYRLSTSHAMANAMAAAYEATKPTVIYNAFPLAERLNLDNQIKDRRDQSLASVHWFSQTIGVGRGLEILMECLPLLKVSAEIHLRGDCSVETRKWLDSLIPQVWQDRVFVHPTVPPEELLSRIAEHDVGLCLEIPYCQNKQTTASNKLFQYLLAGVAVVATDTAGQVEVLSDCPGAAVLVPADDALALARALNELLSNTQRLSATKSAALRAAQDVFCWEKQSSKLTELAQSALETPPHGFTQ